MSKVQGSMWQHCSHPWETRGSRQLSAEERAEISLFLRQDRFEREDEAMQQAFEREMAERRAAFQNKKEVAFANRYYPFAHRLWHKRIQHTRCNAVPAYTFTMFNQLPPELQLRIWSMAARTEEPQLHPIVSVSQDVRPEPTIGSSPIYRPYGTVPTVLHVCKSSRKVAQSIFARLPSTENYHNWEPRETYYNTLYDIFYMGGDGWKEFKILADLVIRDHTTRSQSSVVQSHMKGFQRIRNLVVDLDTFGAAPCEIWAEFSQLEVLTIAFYTCDSITGYASDIISFLHPVEGSKHWKRAAWIVESATKAFAEVKKELPYWRMPEINALPRATDDEELNWEVQNGRDSDSDNEVEDDSAWYTLARERMVHRVSAREIKLLKRKYLPSERADYDRAFLWRTNKDLKKKYPGELLTDSETEDLVAEG